MPVVWTAAARKQLAPRSGEGAAAPRRMAVGAAWGTVRRALTPSRFDPVTATFEDGANEASSPYREWMAEGASLARSRSMPRFDDVNVAAVFALLVSKLVDHALVTSIYPRQGGLSFAFEVALVMQTMDVASKKSALWVHERKTPCEADPWWRDVLLAEPDEIRAECKEVGARLWPAATPSQKATIAYAFFDEPAWVDDACRACAETSSAVAPELLYAIVREKDVAFELVRRRTQSRSLLELVETFGDAILPALVEVAAAPRENDARWVAEALAQIDDVDAAAALAPLVKYAPARPYVQDYFARYPAYADALSGVGGGGRAAMVAKEVRAGANRARANNLNEASFDELPPLFRSPPWREKKRSVRPVATLSLALIDRPMTVSWQAGEKELALTIARRYTAMREDATPQTIALHAAALKKHRAAGFFVHSHNQRLPDESVLATWTSGVPTYGPSAGERLRYAVAKFGERALEGVVRFLDLIEREVAHGEPSDASFLLRIGSPRMALGMAKLQSSAALAPLVWRWLLRHAEAAVLGLVPAAFDDRTREDAERALLRLAAAGTDVLAIGSAYGDEAKAALETLLTWDTLDDVPKRAPKLGASWKPSTFTRPVTTSGKLLPIAAVDAIGTMLAFSAIEPPYAGLAIVKSLCTPRSLAELAWDAARSWERAGQKKRERWMLSSLVHFADDEIVRRFTPALRDEMAVDLLERIDTDTALMALATIAGRAAASGDSKLAYRVEAILDRAAAVRGIDKDELEEELAPVKPIEADGTVSLDFGPRKLRVGFDEHLQPFVINDAGERVRALAPARKGDDAERAEKAKALWRDLKEDVSVLAARRIAGLRRAMTSGRTWTAARFQRVWIDNGLMKHLARGIVWTDGATAFRVAEDGSLSTSTDATFSLGADARVRVLHPLRAAREEIERFRALFVDYLIIQPFAQLARAPLERTSDRVSVPLGGLHVNDLANRLLARGFMRTTFSGGRWGFRRELLARGAVGIEFSGVGGRVTDPEVIFIGEDLDVIEIADIVDELQAGAPPSSI